MPTLEDTLRGRDLSFLQMVAGAWGLDLSAPDAATYLPLLASSILNHQWQADVLEALPGDAQQALQALAQNEGRFSWALFTRRFGEVRPFGPGKRQKERPDRAPASPAEWLWYRALIGRAFLKDSSEREPVEYAYIPDDLLALVHPLVSGADAPPGRPASPQECARALPADDSVLDQACSLLAWLRLELPPAEWPGESEALPGAGLLELLKAARLVDDTGQVMAEPVRAFLEEPRGEALARLAHEWMRAIYLNELRMLPGLVFEGDWLNDPLQARQAVLSWVGRVPAGSWWSLAAFVRAIREQDPDFQRPTGDYDSWFIRSQGGAAFLRGFEHWDEVDGALVRFLTCGPLHWLGFVDLASAPSGEVSAFRFSRWAEDLLHGAPPKGLAAEQAHLKVTPAGWLSLPALFPRAARYNIARFCAWDAQSSAEYRYRITPSSLERAARQGLRPRQLAALLRRHAETGQVPPSLIQALERWEGSGTQAVMEQALLLRLSTPDALAALKRSRAGRFIQEELSPTLVVLRPGTQEKVLEALVESGYLAELRLEV